MFTTVESSTTMSWASATVVSVHHRREDAASAPGVAEEVRDMGATVSSTIEFRNSRVPEVTSR
jgi:hypothetical protein